MHCFPSIEFHIFPSLPCCPYASCILGEHSGLLQQSDLYSAGGKVLQCRENRKALSESLHVIESALTHHCCSKVNARINLAPFSMVLNKVNILVFYARLLTAFFWFSALWEVLAPVLRTGGCSGTHYDLGITGSVLNVHFAHAGRAHGALC